MMQQPQQQQQQTTVVNMGGQQPAAPYMVGVQPMIIQKYNRQQSLGLGITLIVAAVLSCIFNIVDISVSNAFYFSFGHIGHGFWTGIMCIIAGGFGIGAGLRKTKCMICTFNVMSIIAASFTLGQFVSGIVGAAVINNSLCGYGYNYYSSYNYYRYYSYTNYDNDSCLKVTSTLAAMESLLVILSVVEAVAAIWGSAICCRAYCCCDCCCCTGPPNNQPMPYGYGNGGVQMMVVSSSQQSSIPAMYPAQAYPAYPQAQPGQPGYDYNQPQQYPVPQPGYYPPAQQAPAGQHGAMGYAPEPAGFTQPPSTSPAYAPSAGSRRVYDNAQPSKY